MFLEVLEGPGAPWSPLRPLEAPGGPWRFWRRLEASGGLEPCRTAWKPTCMELYLQTLIYTMAYNIYNDGFRVLGTRNWDLRWIMTRALLRDTYVFRQLVECLWTPEGFQAPNAIH